MQMLFVAILLSLRDLRQAAEAGRADSKFVTGTLAGAVSMRWGRRNRLLLVLKSVSAPTNLDLIS
jgi:hypothetical protein